MTLLLAMIVAEGDDDGDDSNVSLLNNLGFSSCIYRIGCSLTKSEDDGPRRKTTRARTARRGGNKKSPCVAFLQF